MTEKITAKDVQEKLNEAKGPTPTKEDIAFAVKIVTKTISFIKQELAGSKKDGDKDNTNLYTGDLKDWKKLLSLAKAGKLAELSNELGDLDTGSREYPHDAPTTSTKEADKFITDIVDRYF